MHVHYVVYAKKHFAQEAGRLCKLGFEMASKTMGVEMVDVEELVAGVAPTRGDYFPSCELLSGIMSLSIKNQIPFVS